MKHRLERRHGMAAAHREIHRERRDAALKSAALRLNLGGSAEERSLVGPESASLGMTILAGLSLAEDFGVGAGGDDVEEAPAFEDMA
jgi:hypothetical protein